MEEPKLSNSKNPWNLARSWQRDLVEGMVVAKITSPIGTNPQAKARASDMAAEKRGLLTTGQAARLCAVTPDTVLKWIKKGRLSATRTAGGHYRVALPDLEPFMAGFGQGNLQPTMTESSPTIPSQGGTKEESDEVPCWDFLSDGGELRDACRQCVVYRVKATRCFLMAGLESDVGHAHQFCEGTCEDCIYYRRIQGMSTQVLFVSSDEELVNRLEWAGDDSISLRFARNGYEASALVQDFRPEIAIIDLEGLPDHGLGLLDSIAADPRLPHIRVILVIPPEAMGRMLQRPRHRLVVSMLEKPHVCDQIEEVVKGSMVELDRAPESRSA
ncbi:MAG: excisionase family DNA-binding protein [Gemmatimonadota bacterium]